MMEARQIRIKAGSFELSDVSFRLEKGTYGVLMGRTGSGKTTILECLCGLRPIRHGSILLHGLDVTHTKPAARGIGYVPQDRALFGSMSVRKNLSFALEVRGWPAAQMEARVAELADMLGITALLSRSPHSLSGGESQRVALGRALAMQPSFLCLDEPLSALDEETREDMYRLLQSLQRQTGVTVLHVTHHRSEAERLAHQILLLKDGQLCVVEKAADGSWDWPTPPPANGDAGTPPLKVARSPAPGRRAGSSHAPGNP